MTQPHTTVSSIGLLVLRVGMGAYIAFAHGWGKVQMRLDNQQFHDPLGIGNEMSLTLAALSEFGGGLLVLLGLATRFGAAAVVFTMGVAAFVHHADDPWASLKSGVATKEMALLYFIGFLAVVFTGPGKFSLDALIQKRWRDRRNKG